MMLKIACIVQNFKESLNYVVKIPMFCFGPRDD